MRMAYKDDEGKVAILNTQDDEVLMSTEWINGREQSRWQELLMHETKGGKRIFYIAGFSRWQGEPYCVINVIDDIQDWLTDNLQLLSQKQIDRLAELGIKVEETA
jgi:hypothetical protein